MKTSYTIYSAEKKKREFVVRAGQVGCCCSHISWHSQVRGDRIGSLLWSGKKTQDKKRKQPKWCTYICVEVGRTSIPFIKVLPSFSVNASGSFRAFLVRRRPTAMSSGVEFSYRPSWVFATVLGAG